MRVREEKRDRIGRTVRFQCREREREREIGAGSFCDFLGSGRSGIIWGWLEVNELVD